MKMPNGYGIVYKLSGKRREPWVVRKAIGCDKNGKQLYSTLGYFSTRQQCLQALATFNDNPSDLELSKTAFSQIYELWFYETFN